MYYVTLVAWVLPSVAAPCLPNVGCRPLGLPRHPALFTPSSCEVFIKEQGLQFYYRSVTDPQLTTYSICDHQYILTLTSTKTVTLRPRAIGKPKDRGPTQAIIEFEYATTPPHLRVWGVLSQVAMSKWCTAWQGSEQWT
jgi:hypothetical protein